MKTFKLEPSYQYKLDSMPRNGTSNELITNVCTIPYQSLTIDYNSNCFICICDGWLPVPVGKVQDFTSLQDVWDSPIAKQLQQDITDKKFTWCATDHCGIKQQNKLTEKYTLLLNIDESCNLWCPSCRRSQIMHSTGPVVDSKTRDVETVLQWIDNFQYPIHIVLTGNGDPLASTIIRPLINKYTSKPGQTFTLLTNGLLIKKQLVGLPILENITEFSISTDAGTSEVYQQVRRGGQWKILLDNFDFLKSLGKESLVKLNFAVQNKNFRDIPNFIALCNQYNFGASIHQLDDWGTWNSEISETPDKWSLSNGIFSDHNVVDSNHPNNQEYRKIIRDLVDSNSNPRIKFSNIIKERI